MVAVRGRRRAYLERRRIGRRDYYLLQHVSGPFRQSYLAFDPQSGPGGDFFLVQTLEYNRRTEQQLRVLRRLKSDAYPRCVEWQRRRESVDVVLTWTEGIALNDYLENIRQSRRPSVSPNEAIRLIHGLSHGVCQLNDFLQVAHGDIQPANIIVTNRPSRLKLIDLGSAWVVEDTVQREQGDGHHRSYAAPELQVPGVGINGLFADQFSVSVVLYELLTGELPYDGLGGKIGRPEFVTKAQRALSPPSAVSRACQRLPRSLREGIDRVTLRGLALKPEDRYPNRHAWLNDLFEVSARFRLAPEVSTVDRFMTRVVRWFIAQRDKASKR